MCIVFQEQEQASKLDVSIVARSMQETAKVDGYVKPVVDDDSVQSERFVDLSIDDG